MKLGERKYTQDEGPAQEPWTEAPGKSPRAADGKTGVQDAPCLLYTSDAADE